MRAEHKSSLPRNSAADYVGRIFLLFLFLLPKRNAPTKAHLWIVWQITVIGASQPKVAREHEKKGRVVSLAGIRIVP